MAVGIGSAMFKDALGTFRASWRRVVLAEVFFKLLGVVLSTAGSAVVLAWVELRTGGGAITNTDLVGFLVRPISILLLLVVVGVGTTFALVEQGVLLSILGRGRLARGSFGEFAKAAAAGIQRIARLAAICVGIVLAVLLVTAVLLGAVYKGLLAGTDINYYLSAKPPVFLVAAAIGGVIALAAGVVLTVLFVRWFLALSITVFEGMAPRRALAESAARVRGNRWRILLTIVLWDGAIAILTMLLLSGIRYFAARSLSLAEGSTARALGIIVAILAVNSLVAAVSSFLTVVGHALIVLHIYREVSPDGAAALTATAAGRGDEAKDGEPAAVPWMRGPAGLSVLVVLVVAAFVLPACLLVYRLGRQDVIEVSAHRGASKVAPENTLAAVQAAIDARAEWAEIDVQETADGHVLVLHDQDLMRLAGVPKKIAEMTFEEARQIDVGTKFDPRFAGERLPTLEEVLDLARGKIRLNVELKYYGKDPRLAPDVARILREAGCEKDCFVASLDFGSLAEARKEWPALRTAAIVTARVGDPTRLDVDILSMNAKQVNLRFLRTARRRGKEVLVWTVDDPKLARRMMDLGVDNLITNDPATMVRLRDERSALTRVERIVLAFRVLLGADTTHSAPVTEPVEEL